MNWKNNNRIKMIDFPLTSKTVPFHLNGLLRKGVVKVLNIMEIPFIVDAKTMSNQKNNKIFHIILVNRLIVFA